MINNVAPRKKLPGLAGLLAICALAFPAADLKGEAEVKEAERVVIEPVTRDPEEARRLLLEGNKRFVDGKTVAPGITTEERRALVEGQSPFAVILACSDSRAPVDMVFDKDPGNLFVIRVAGNLSSPAAEGSIEYALGHLEPSIVVVMGHERCGAVVAASLPPDETSGEPRHVQTILRHIRPAIQDLESNQDEKARIEAAVLANVRAQMEHLQRNPVVSRAVAEEKIQLVGAYYKIETGEVRFLDPQNGTGTGSTP
jgi:carbonic anhydrase